MKTEYVLTVSLLKGKRAGHFLLHLYVCRMMY